MDGKVMVKVRSHPGVLGCKQQFVVFDPKASEVGGWSHHHVRSPEWALLNLFCFSSFQASGGSDLPVQGSHHLAARRLWAAEPDGFSTDNFEGPLCGAFDRRGWPGVVEIVASEGDVVLSRPMVFQASNPNRGARPRALGLPALSPTEPVRTERDGLFPVEVAVARSRQ